MVAPVRPDCGIGDYSRDLVAELRARTTVETCAIEHLDPAAAALDADVVHLQYEHGFFLDNDDPAGNVDLLFSALRPPVLVTLHCLPLEDPRWRRWLEAPGFAYHVHSREHRLQLLRLAPRAVVYETPLPIGARTPAGISAAEFRQQFGVGERRLLAMFGFIKAHKGYDVAVAALARLPEDIVLVLAGGPQDAADAATLESVHDAARHQGVADRLRVTGYLPASTVGAALTAADVVLAPFHSVTASASLAAALTWERPIVASALPQIEELLARFGCVQCFPVGDADALAAAVRALLADEAARQRLVAGAQRARAACSIDRVAARIEQAYRELATAFPRAAS